MMCVYIYIHLSIYWDYIGIMEKEMETKELS